MKKILKVCILITGLIAIILGFLYLMGIITTQWDWISFTLVVLMIFMIGEEFLIKGEPNKIKNARILLGVIKLLVCALTLLVFIKSVLR